MTNSRRQFLKIASAGAAVTRLGISATSEPTVGLIFPPANYPMPPEVHKMYPSGIRFLGTGVGLPSMTPEGYDSVIDKIVPSALELQKQGANVISVFGSSLTFYKGAAFNKQLSDAVTKPPDCLQPRRATGSSRASELPEPGASRSPPLTTKK
jgi:maleate cis-trans isomerase